MENTSLSKGGKVHDHLWQQFRGKRRLGGKDSPDSPHKGHSLKAPQSLCVLRSLTRVMQSCTNIGIGHCISACL